MMRLDKFLCETTACTRSEAKQLIKGRNVFVNNSIAQSADLKINETLDTVFVHGEKVIYEKYHYYILHKPAGVVTATEDRIDKTVMDLLSGIDVRNLFPVGRLDKDTEGLLLITDNGELSHRLLSPKNHVPKTYYMKLRNSFTDSMKQCLEEGVDIGDHTKTLPAKVEVINDKEINLTICEGRFHQVKRMLVAVNNEVLYLKRISFGKLLLPDNLDKGNFRKLEEKELLLLK